jgi:cytochrome c oxidase cbb3-type subunit 3
MTRPPENEDPIRHHSYDGIQEYDKRLPNWWLFTLYITIVFWACYWSYYEWFHAGPDGRQRVEQQIAAIEAVKLASSPATDDASLWKMSRNPAFVEAGKAVFTTNCVVCHLASLKGKDEVATAIGPNLTDTKWIHGGRPSEVYDLITKGVLVKGMPSWGPVLGQKRITEAVAYVLSFHQEGEPIEILPAAPTTPPAP